MKVHAYCRFCGIVHICHVSQESEYYLDLKCDKSKQDRFFVIKKSHTSPEEEKQND